MILLLGSTGYIGQAFAGAIQLRNEPVCCLSRKNVDYTNRDTLVDLLREAKPSFVINAAGFTGKPNVDACEKYRSECLAGNAVLPGVVRDACELVGVSWGHVSSGCIFTGHRSDGAPFTEEDAPNFCFRTDNCSWYSGCKALGEECLAGSDSVYVWRPRIPFNHEDSGRNYLSKLLRYKQLLNVENSISHLNEFANACLDCWFKRVPPGTYNVTNTGSLTTKQITELLSKHLCLAQNFEFFEDEAEFMAVAAKTPRSNCTMDNSKLLSVGV